MAVAVGRTLGRGGALVVEAGTGVGKSLAYLIPGLELALEEQRPLLVSTATLTLQSQLLDKDIPAALKALGHPSKSAEEVCARAVGRANYFCALRLEFLRGPKSEELLPGMPASHLEKLETWANSEPRTLRERLPFPVDAEVWDRVNVDAFHCLGSLCPHARKCYFLKDKERLRQARLIVANHALVFADVQARRQQSAALPDCPRVVFDEAHHLERLAGEHLGLRLSEIEFEKALDPVLDSKGKGLFVRLGFPEGLAEDIKGARKSARDLFLEAADEARRAPKDGIPRMSDGSSLWLEAAAGKLRRAVENSSDEALVAEVKSQAIKLERLGEAIKSWCSQEDGGQIYWVDASPRKGALLRSAPLKPGDLMAAELYPRFESMVFTSATLATHQGLGFMKKRLGLAEDTEELVLASPFDYASQAELHLTRSMPSPADDEAAWMDGMEAGIKAALLRSEGRAFVLFTSFRHLEALAGRLKPFVQDQGWDFLSQDGRVSRDRLLERFRSSGKAVLFGAQSFWEGVDVQGEALSCVILTRLPFSVPDTPLEKARSRQVEMEGGKPFFDLALPEAVLRLKQGFGRLIRHSKDRGHIHLLDSRVLGKSYGRAFLKALPPARVFVDGLEQEA